MAAGGEVPYGTIALYITEMLLWLAALAFLCARKGSHLLHPKRLHILIVLFLGVFLLLSFFTAPYPLTIFFTALHLVEGMLLFFLISNYPKKTVLAIAFLCALTAQSLLAIHQSYTQEVLPSTIFGIAAQEASNLGVAVVETHEIRVLRAYGGLPHPNILGGYLAIGILIAAMLYLILQRKIEGVWQQAQSSFLHTARWLLVQDIFLTVSMLLMTLALLLTFSRSAWIALLLSFVVFAVLLSIQKKKREGIAFLKVFFLISIVAIGTYSMMPDIIDTRIKASTRTENISLTERSAGLTNTIERIKEHPWLGVGLGQGALSLIPKKDAQPGWVYQPTHNTFLLIFLEIGIIGIGLFITLLAILFKSFKKRVDVLFIAPFGVLLITLGLFDHYLWSLYPGILLFFTGLGLTSALSTLYYERFSTR